MTPPDRKPIGTCEICGAVGYYRRNYVDPDSGKRHEGIGMCKRDSDSVTRNGFPGGIRLTAEDRQEIFDRREAGEAVNDLAEAYGVSRQTIWRILKGYV